MYKKIALLLFFCNEMLVCCGVDISGTVVDGLRRPVEGASVEIYAGHQEMDGYGFLVRTNLSTTKDGVYKCKIDAELATLLQRKVTKEGYCPVSDEVSEWKKQNDMVVLYRRMEITHGLVTEFFSETGDRLNHRILELLGSEWFGSVGVLPLEVFRYGDKLRPALLNAVTNGDPRVSCRAKELLAYVGDMRDKEYIVENKGRLPVKKIEHVDLLDAVKMAAETLSTSTDDRYTILSERHWNKSGERALMFVEFFGMKRNYFRTCALIFCRSEAKWVFTHYWVVIES
jgi:hypothetical protein